MTVKLLLLYLLLLISVHFNEVKFHLYFIPSYRFFLGCADNGPIESGHPTNAHVKCLSEAMRMTQSPQIINFRKRDFFAIC